MEGNDSVIIVQGNLFEQRCDAIVIPTNGYYTYQNEAVMGRGVALQASKKWPECKKRLGYMLQMHGTNVFMISRKKRIGDYYVVNFPVKPRFGVSNGMNVVNPLGSKFPAGTEVPGWAMKADIKLKKKG